MSELRILWSITTLPADCDFVASEDALAAASSAFTKLLAGRGHHDHHVERHATPRFYGSEGFSYSATCPSCGNVIRRKFKEPGTEGRLWFGALDMLAAHNVEGSTPITMPGCGHVVALSTIAFEFATRAARCALVAELTWWDDDLFRDDSEATLGALEAISEAMGTPVRFVRALHLLLPAQRRAIARLMSTDERERLTGARALEAVQEDENFQHDSIYSMFIEDHLDALRAALRADTRPQVRRWLMSLLYNAECFVSEFLDALAAALRGDGELLDSAAHMASCMPPALITPMLPLIRALHTHPGNAIRRNCSTALRRLRAHSPEDREAVRVLALDPTGWAQLDAVHTMKDWITSSGTPMEAVDRAVLEQVVARSPARDDLLKIAQPLLS